MFTLVKKMTKMNQQEEEEERNEPQQEASWIRTLKYDDPKKFYWDQVILFFAIYNSLFIPLTLNFDEINTILQQQVWHTTIDLGSTLFFMLDIFLEFNMTFVDSTGEQISDRSKIAKKYLQGMFIIDLLSSLPIELIAHGSRWRILNILKLLRISRLTALINNSNIDSETKTFCRILQLIFLMIIYMHVIACIQNSLVDIVDDYTQYFPSSALGVQNQLLDS